jgi:hypothetical protein
MIRRLVLATVAASAGLVASEDAARACGACFHPPTDHPTVVTDHRMILSIAREQTTLYDQMRYSGSPAEFAWVLPIAGQVDIGLSSDTLFQTLDGLTGVTVEAPVLPACDGAAACAPNFPVPSAAPGAAAGGASDGVNVLKTQVVGPYETVQLQATDPQGLNHWLAAHNYAVGKEAQGIIDQYVKEHFDFLAMKLLPGTGVQAMRPVRITTKGAGLSLPLRMIAAGAGANVGITLWIMAEGRYEPQNFPFFVIPEDMLVWDWQSSSSNYAALRSSLTTASMGRAWQIESSLDLDTTQIRNGVQYGGGFVGGPAFPGGGAGGPIGDSVPGQRDDYPAADGKTSDQLMKEDLDAACAGQSPGSTSIRVTRIRADLAHTALATDLTLQAAGEQTNVANLLTARFSKNAPSCPVYAPNSCSVVGQAPRALPSAPDVPDPTFLLQNAGKPGAPRPPVPVTHSPVDPVASPAPGAQPPGDATTPQGTGSLCSTGTGGATDLAVVLVGAFAGIALLGARRKSKVTSRR